MTNLPTRRVLASLTALALVPALATVSMGAPAAAAPLPAPYAASAHGDLVNLTTTLPGTSLADLKVAHSRATVDSDPTLADNSVAESKNVEAAVAGFPIPIDSATATAPPSEDPPARVMLGVPLSPVATVGAITGDVVANYTDASSCVPAVGGRRALSAARTDLAGLTLLSVPGVGTVADVGASWIRSETELVDQAVGGAHVVSTTTTEVADIALLGGQVVVKVSDPVVVRATSNGTTGTAGFVNPPTVVVTIAGTDTPIPLNGTAQTISLPAALEPIANLTITAFTPTPQSTGAIGEADLQNLLHIDLDVLSALGEPLVGLDLGVAPLHVRALAPTGGVECVADTSTFVTIDSPDGTSTLADQPVTFTGTREPGATVVVTDASGDVVCTAVAAPDGSWSCTGTVEEGTQLYTATATDAAGNTATYTVTLTVDSVVAGGVTILTPAEGSTTNDNTPLISGTTEPGAAVVVTDSNGNTVCSTTADAVTGAWSCTPSTALPEGPNTLTATATDGAGNTATDTTTFTVDSAVTGGVTILTPASGSTTTDSTPLVSGTTEPGAAVVVTDSNGDTVCSTTADAVSGAWSCTPSAALPLGANTLTATATDGVGNTATDTTTFTVAAPNPGDTTPPAAPVITSPAEGSSTPDTTPTVTGTAEPGSTVTVSEGGSVICTAVADAAGNWTCTPATPLAAGAHTLSATATDAAGNTSPADTVSFTITDTTAPAAPVITSPAEGGSTTDTTPTVTGTGEPGATITVTEGGTTVCTATVAPDGTWSCTGTTPLPLGQHTFTATATDAAGNTSPADTVTFTVAPPANPDRDNDGLPNGDETKPGTNPDDPDTDNDGLTDGEEVDHDGSGPDKGTGTDPLKADTDGDGLGDGQEVNTTTTDPLDPDTDNDGLEDGPEVLGMTVKERFELCGKKARKQIRVTTNPLVKDTDRDGLTDGREVKGYRIKQVVFITRSGETVTIGKTRSNPTEADTDRDRITDKVEKTGSANKKFKRRKTDPTTCDTDGGGVSDGREIKLGSDPTRIKSGPNDLESRMWRPRSGAVQGG